VTLGVRLLRRGVVFEPGMWRAPYRWLRRRPDVPPGVEAFADAGAVTPVIRGFVVVSAVEVVVVHVVVPEETVRWVDARTARLPADGAAQRGRRRPAGASRGDGGRVLVPWEDVAAVQVRRRSVEGSRTVHRHADGPQRAVSVTIGASTALVRRLRAGLGAASAR
jgi:hypothetical protein